VPEEVGRLVTASVKIPTIGIGAGRYCDGQVLVFHDLIGLEQSHRPRFVRRYASLRAPALEALAAFKREVEEGRFPSDQEVYRLEPEVARALLERHGVGAHS
jgi:3-methyl-2-oxobutanoate hydroxymethyltransferase